jgi:hypothetical protein
MDSRGNERRIWLLFEVVLPGYQLWRAFRNADGIIYRAVRKS